DVGFLRFRIDGHRFRLGQFVALLRGQFDHGSLLSINPTVPGPRPAITASAETGLKPLSRMDYDCTGRTPEQYCHTGISPPECRNAQADLNKPWVSLRVPLASDFRLQGHAEGLDTNE